MSRASPFFVAGSRDSDRKFIVSSYSQHQTVALIGDSFMFYVIWNSPFG